MKLILVVLILVVSSLANTCYDGDLYLFTEESVLYQSNSASGTIAPYNISINCLPSAVTNAGQNVLLSCYEKQGNYKPVLMTISENKVVSTVAYASTCSVGPVAYSQNNS